MAAINFTDYQTPFTRRIEHKHFDPVTTDHTVITPEYPADWKIGDEMYYPVNNDAGLELQRDYVARLPANYLIGGRLATYRYLDMHQVVASAIHLADKEIATDQGRLKSIRITARRAA